MILLKIFLNLRIQKVSKDDESNNLKAKNEEKSFNEVDDLEIIEDTSEYQTRTHDET